MATEKRFCINCKHLYPSLLRCTREADHTPDLVTGLPNIIYTACPPARTQRTLGECGPDALYWEAKEGV